MIIIIIYIFRVEKYILFWSLIVKFGWKVIS